jgi:hypothetical protein
MDIVWLKLTVYNQSNIYMAIRQLEFSLLQMFRQIDALFAAVQTVLHSKLPMALVDPTTLQYILRNVSFLLPENYELIAGTRKDNIYLYYDLIKVALVGNAHGIKLIMRVPIRLQRST